MSIFKEEENKETKSTSQVDDTNVANKFDDLLNGIKNDSGERKYSSVESALEALKHSQEYIPNLQGDKDKLTQELDNLKGQQNQIDDLTTIVERLTAKKVEPSDQTNETLGEQDVAKLVQSILNQNKTTSLRDTNTESVTKALAAKYGTEAEKEFYGKADALGMTKEAFNDLAATSPKAVLSFFGDIQQDTSLMKGSENVNHSFQKPPHSGKVEKSEKSVMAGASTKDLVAEMEKHKLAVYAKHGVEH
jgi:hypothetical protein